MEVLGYAADADAGALRAQGARLVWSMSEVPAALGVGAQAGSGRVSSSSTSRNEP